MGRTLHFVVLWLALVSRQMADRRVNRHPDVKPAVLSAPTFFVVDSPALLLIKEELFMFSMLLQWVGRLAAVAGVLLSAIVGLLRLQGHYFLGGLSGGDFVARRDEPDDDCLLVLFGEN